MEGKGRYEYPAYDAPENNYKTLKERVEELEEKVRELEKIIKKIGI